MTEVTAIDTRQVKRQGAETVLAAQPAGRKRSAPRTRDSVGQARGKKAQTQENNPAFDPMASSSSSDGNSDGGYYMNPISWMLAILAKSAEMSNELTQAFTENLTTLMTTIRDQAKYLGEQQKTELDLQAQSLTIGGISKAVGAGISIAGAAASVGAGVYSKVKTSSLSDEIDVPSSETVASKPESLMPADDVSVGNSEDMELDSVDTGAGAAGAARRGPRVEVTKADAAIDSESVNNKEPMSKAEKLAQEKRTVRRGNIERNFSSINNVGSGLAQAGGTGGQAIGDLLTVKITEDQGEAKKNQALADGEKQIAASTLQMVDGALQKVSSVFDAEVRAAMEMEGTFSAAVRN